STITIHTVMLCTQVLLAITLFLYLRIENPKTKLETERTTQLILVSLVLLSLFFGFYIFKKKIESLRNVKVVKEKLELFKKACVIKFVCIEFTCFLALLGYFLTQNLSFMILFGVLLLFFALQRPTILSITNYLQLSNNDLYE
ncbi:MAG TPA: hypothetical protein PLH33_03740, partial [Chitinophagaceae bacterium]|nr:hypothetical protein [Chitinophagaceae bacterium]